MHTSRLEENRRQIHEDIHALAQGPAQVPSDHLIAQLHLQIEGRLTGIEDAVIARAVRTTPGCSALAVTEEVCSSLASS